MSKVESPCIRNCCLDDKDICMGCFRSLEEITGWHQASDERKLLIIAHSEERKRAHRQRFPRAY